MRVEYDVQLKQPQHSSSSQHYRNIVSKRSISVQLTTYADILLRHRIKECNVSSIICHEKRDVYERLRNSKGSKQDSRRYNCLLHGDEEGSSSSSDSGSQSRPGRCSVEPLQYLGLAPPTPSLRNDRGRTHLAHGHRLLGTCRLLSDGGFVHSGVGVQDEWSASCVEGEGRT